MHLQNYVYDVRRNGNGSLMANFDNQKFPVLTEKTGLQTVSITNEGLIDFFSLYVAAALPPMYM